MAKVNPGDFVVGNAKARQYSITGKGVLCYVKEIVPGGRLFSSAGDEIRVIVLAGEHTGEAFNVDPDAFDVLSEAQIKARHEEAIAAVKALETGDMVPGMLKVLKSAYTHAVRFFFFSFKQELPKGTEMVVDYNPHQKDAPRQGQEDSDDDEVKTPVIDDDDLDTKLGDSKWKIRDFHTPLIKVYVPSLDTIIPISAALLTDKPAKGKLFKNLVLPDGEMDRILTSMGRVLDRDIHEEMYEKLGLTHVCQKGRGAIILLYGPPGTGKSMTAEACAEKVGRPLIRLNVGSVTNPEQMANNLMSAFKKAAKYKAILLLDEVDVFIKRRGQGVYNDEATSTFLRTLEYYDGILFMTTNLASDIDEAVFSRVHVCVELPKFTDTYRKGIWRAIMPPELLSHIRGTDAEKDALMDSLSKFDLNGREIKTVIQNAVSRAVFGLGDKLPEIKFIPEKYFSEEAEMLLTHRDGLRTKKA